MLRIALLLLAVPSAQAADPPRDSDAADRLLVEALRAVYPEVKRWEVNAIADRASARDAIASGDSRMEVVHLGARSALRVTTPTRHGTLRQTTLWYAVAGFQDVQTAVRPLTAWAAIEAGDLAAAERDILAAGCKPARVEPAKTAERWRTKVSLRQGQTICDKDIEPRPLVSRGEPITITYSGAALTLTARAIAQNDGGIGERVRVRNPVTKEIFVGAVSGAAEVSIHE